MPASDFSFFPLSLLELPASLLPPELPQARPSKNRSTRNTVQASFLNFICILLLISVSILDNEFFTICIRFHFIRPSTTLLFFEIVLFKTGNKTFRNLFWSSNRSTNNDTSHPIFKDLRLFWCMNFPSAMTSTPASQRFLISSNLDHLP